MSRAGTSYDVRPFAEGRPFILGGVEIPHYEEFQGYSDADVVPRTIR